MSITVSLVRSGTTLYTFSVTPFAEPAFAYEYTSTQPPSLAACARTWTFNGKIYGSSTNDTRNKFSALQNIVENVAGTGGVDTLYLKNDTGTIQVIGYDASEVQFKIEKLRVVRTDLMWRGEVEIELVVSSKKLLVPSGTGTISTLNQRESYTYDEAGLLTHTLIGDLTVTTGSALAIARTLGLSLPSAYFAYATNGTGGVDVEVLDNAGLQARFTSTIVQSAAALPSGVGPSYSKGMTVVRKTGETSTTYTVRAVGTGAANAVAAERPSNCTGETITTNQNTLEATATYVVERMEAGVLVRTHTMTSSGGGRPIAFTERSQGRLPAEHKLPFVPATVTEDIRIEVLGVPGIDDFKIPNPISGLEEDTSRFELDPFPVRIKRGPTTAGDRWAMGMRRVYRAPTLKEMFTPAVQSIFAAAKTSPSFTPSREIDIQARG